MKNIQSKALRVAVLCVALSASAFSVQARVTECSGAKVTHAPAGGNCAWGWCMSFCNCICGLFSCGSSSTTSGGDSGSGASVSIATS